MLSLFAIPLFVVDLLMEKLTTKNTRSQKPLMHFELRSPRASVRRSGAFFLGAISMPSSTSGSKSKAMTYAKAPRGYLCRADTYVRTCLDYLLNHRSATYARISRQYDEALKIRPASAGEPPNVLMVGNSLLLHGVQVNRLQEMNLLQHANLPYFPGSDGLLRLAVCVARVVSAWSQAAVLVVLGVSAVNYFIENGVRQDYAPMMFFDARGQHLPGFRLEIGSHRDQQSTAGGIRALSGIRAVRFECRS